MTPRCSILVVAAALLGATGALRAQDSKPASPETKPAPQPQPHEPTLDELLGLPNAKPAAPKPGDAKPEAVDRAKAELERELNPAEVSEAFEQAVQLMGQTADRLDGSHDTGLDTQRMQEDVIRKLDTIIAQAKKQQSQSKSKKPKPDSSQKQQQQQQQSSQQNAKTNDPKQGGGPALQNGPGHGSPGGAAVWGNLPEHVRTALIEGTTEGFSSMYKTLTQKYYERLAKEPTPDTAPPPPSDKP